MRLLIIEDDYQAAVYLAKGLKESGFAVDHAVDGNEGLYMAMSEPYDILIVDRMLPRRDGLSVIAALRAQGTMTPVLILSALGEIDDRV
ncbi:MAG TPA: response regulator, partial [Gammaproteobacteria bacterium]|nr:response regulator [Gammaproteobacteria bacterium]